MLRASSLSILVLISLAEALPRYLENYRPDDYRRQESYRDALNQKNHLYKLLGLLQDDSPGSGDAPMPDPLDSRVDAFPGIEDAPIPDTRDFKGDAFPGRGDAPIPEPRKRQESYRDSVNQNDRFYKLLQLLQEDSPASGDAPIPDPQNFRGDAFPGSGDAPISDTRDFEADAFPGRVYF